MSDWFVTSNDQINIYRDAALNHSERSVMRFKHSSVMNDELIQINADQYKVSKAIKRKLTFTNILSK